MAMKCSEFVPYSSKQGHKQIKRLLIHTTENFTSLDRISDRPDIVETYAYGEQQQQHSDFSTIKTSTL
jgi:hypothetical protein